jgi:cytochrome b6-f complex iron-sulfur subunit
MFYLKKKIMERKDFLSKFIVGGSILFTAPVILSSCGDDDDDITDGGNNGGGENTVDLSSSAYADLGTVGGFAYKGDIIIIRTGDSQYVALTKICTHQGCTVAYNPADTQIQCPCHGSAFTTGGAVVNGPATSALKKYTVTKNGDILTIK